MSQPLPVHAAPWIDRQWGQQARRCHGTRTIFPSWPDEKADAARSNLSAIKPLECLSKNVHAGVDMPDATYQFDRTGPWV